MGLFNKIFKQNDTHTSENTSSAIPQPEPATSERELLERYAALAHEKQLHLGEVIGQNNWNVDVRQGTIQFGADLVFPMQILGTFSHSAQTWLWAWANAQSQLPESILQQALKLKQYGEQNHIDLLRHAEFDAQMQDLHMIGSIASGLFGASAYYIADYGQGAMVLTVQHPQIDGTRTHNHLRTLTTFPAVITQYEMDHKTALTHYLNAKGYTVTNEGQTLCGTRGTDTLTASFDDLGRLTSLNG